MFGLFLILCVGIVSGALYAIANYSAGVDINVEKLEVNEIETLVQNPNNNYAWETTATYNMSSGDVVDVTFSHFNQFNRTVMGEIKYEITCIEGLTKSPNNSSLEFRNLINESYNESEQIIHGIEYCPSPFINIPVNMDEYLYWHQSNTIIITPEPPLEFLYGQTRHVILRIAFAENAYGTYSIKGYVNVIS